MLYYVDMLYSIKDNIDLYLLVILTMILVANIIDFGFGWVNAKMNKDVKFISSKALYGIIKKMMYFIVLVFFGVSALIVIPNEVSLPAIITLYLGYLASEINSILSHLKVTEDGKKGEVFIDFIEKIFYKGGK